MENEMIERVAVAIGEQAAASQLPWDCRDLARAAIAAMREPTDDMKAVVGGLYGSVERWQLMIDAALMSPTNS